MRPYKNFSDEQLRRNLDCLVRQMKKHGKENARKLMPYYLRQQDEYIHRHLRHYRLDDYMGVLECFGDEETDRKV